ncbi:lipopolysaccharide transport periplasmic protein LptA [Paraglaciecola arctica]|uniref:Lipopolysaccharide export system protein LptA n=1 Tax=Paraglaciecola arctica BSs20135 TaxID=493475 RepID=K6YV47_9ALTE|nr:lipopolysaccharide transport periplasmic protein LptA [Paraglaciecola arctica]GAC20593.1 lipopolysaccharide export system protein LptA [Paraglaciecola arctica BSs20135]|tara:strand:- start:278 stop:826 length:549 start_codon:yes stop_codon:yes gene_type:complete
MLKPFTNRLYSASILVALLFSADSYAGKDDFTKKIELASLYQNADGIAKRASYQGNVVIVQGSLKVSADELEIDASKGEGNEIFIATGNPAKYSQQQEDGSIVTAHADKIEYHRQTRSLTLEGNAEIKQNSSSVKGKSIKFNMELEQIIAQGSDQESGRVITTFQPVSKPKEPKTKQQDKQP